MFTEKMPFLSVSNNSVNLLQSLGVQTQLLKNTSIQEVHQTRGIGLWIELLVILRHNRQKF